MHKDNNYSGSFRRKDRMLSSPSLLLPPANAPSWALERPESVSPTPTESTGLWKKIHHCLAQGYLP